MSQENVELVRRALEAATRRDDEATFALYDPKVEIHGQMDGATYRGLTGVREYFRDWYAAWRDFSTDAVEWIDAGEDIIAALHVRARGRQSGVPVDQHVWHVWTLRDGKLWRLRVYATKAEALEAVGLSEQNDRATALPTIPGDDKIRILNAGVEAVNAREVNEALLTEDFEIVNVSNALTDKTYRGASGAREWLHDFFDVLDENARFEITEIVETGEDYLVVHNRLVGTGSASGLPFDMEWFSAWWFRDGRMARGVGYGSRRAALAAVHGDAHTDS